MRYTCLYQGCDWKNEEHDNIREILEHEKTHPKKDQTPSISVNDTPCDKCNGKGYIEHIINLIDIANAPKTD